jgi:glycosyltransferase involved in cell wall biosynthesis
MAKAVISLLEDPDRAAAMARRARGEVEKYSWAHVSERWAAVYTGRPA